MPALLHSLLLLLPCQDNLRWVPDEAWLHAAAAGLEPMPAAGSIQERTARITADVLGRCDLNLLLLDARAGTAGLPGCSSMPETR